MDLLDHYMNEEGSHIPLLLKVLANQSDQTYTEYHSNLFNFYVDFAGGQIVIEDECRLFRMTAQDGRQSLSLDICHQRLIKKTKATLRK